MARAGATGRGRDRHPRQARRVDHLELDRVRLVLDRAAQEVFETHERAKLRLRDDHRPAASAGFEVGIAGDLLHQVREIH